MNRSYKYFGVFLLLVLLFVCVILMWKHSRMNEYHKSAANNGYPSTSRDVNSANVQRDKTITANGKSTVIQSIAQFDAALIDLRGLNGQEWIEGLRNLTEDVNALAKRSDFESVTAAALMIKRISDLVIGRLMAGEVGAEDTYQALVELNYVIPTERELIEMIGQYYPDAEQNVLASESVLDLASRYEPEVVFPESDYKVPGKTLTGVITERNATLSLMSIAWAKPHFELARLSALYLVRGGNHELRGDELAADLEMKVGKEIILVKPPAFASTFGNMNPKPKDVSKAISDSISEFESDASANN